MKLQHALQIILLNSFCEVHAVASFKVVQQQTIGELGNSIRSLWADNFSATVYTFKKLKLKLLKSGSILLN